MHPDVEATEQTLADRSGQFYDLTEERPRDDDYELKDDVDDEPMIDDDDLGDDDDDKPPQPKSKKRTTLDDPEGQCVFTDHQSTGGRGRGEPHC